MAQRTVTNRLEDARQHARNFLKRARAAHRRDYVPFIRKERTKVNERLRASGDITYKLGLSAMLEIYDAELALYEKQPNEVWYAVHD